MICFLFIQGSVAAVSSLDVRGLAQVSATAAVLGRDDDFRVGSGQRGLRFPPVHPKRHHVSLSFDFHGAAFLHFVDGEVQILRRGITDVYSHRLEHITHKTNITFVEKMNAYC